jgi:hypothetical protein
MASEPPAARETERGWTQEPLHAIIRFHAENWPDTRGR